MQELSLELCKNQDEGGGVSWGFLGRGVYISAVISDFNVIKQKFLIKFKHLEKQIW
jgi:hypothetical protein